MSPRPAWLDAKDDPPVSPAVMLRSEAATTWPTRSARLTLPLLTGRSAATRRILHIAAGLDEARQAERDAQRQLINAQRDTLRAAERTIALLQEQIRMSEQRTLAGLRARLRGTALPSLPSPPSILSSALRPDDDSDDDIPPLEALPLPPPPPDDLELASQAAQAERACRLPLTDEAALEEGIVDANGDDVVLAIAVRSLALEVAGR